MKAKQLNKGIEQLMDEGVAQLFTNQFNGRKIIGTVGQLQFEVIQYRLLHEYGAQCKWEPISLYKACWIESDNPVALENFKKRKSQYMALDKGTSKKLSGLFDGMMEAVYKTNGATFSIDLLARAAGAGVYRWTCCSARLVICQGGNVGGDAPQVAEVRLHLFRSQDVS